MAAEDHGMTKHEYDIKQGVTFVWVGALAVGFIVLFGYTQWGFISDVPTSEIDWVAVGSANAIGLLAAGGWNAIGLISVGGANSIGVITIGGLNSYGFIWSASIFSWRPRIRRGAQEVTYDA